jgi:peptidoglycan/xylan/chitin deacetylase (PgdA/CDA1 family)
MYHYVRPIKNSSHSGIKGLEIDGFVKQIEFFKKNNFKFVTAADLLDCIYDNREIHQNAILLTFDDGLKDHHSYVFPVLTKFEIQGLFFPPIKPIKEKNILDVHKIHFILAQFENTRQLIDEIFELISKFKKQYNLSSPESYLSKLAIPNRFDTGEIVFIKRLLQRELPRELRTNLTDHLFRKYVTHDEESFANELYLSIDDIKEMRESGMYVGTHGYSHEWLSRVSDDDLKYEIEQCLKFYLDINKQKDSWIMCYPYGDYDEKVIKKLREAGCKAALSTKIGDAILDETNSFYLKRYDTNDFLQ